MTKIPFKFIICLALFSKTCQSANNSQMANAGVDKRNFVDLFVDSVCTFCNILITCCHEQRPEVQFGISLLPNVLQNQLQFNPGHRKPLHKTGHGKFQKKNRLRYPAAVNNSIQQSHLAAPTSDQHNKFSIPSQFEYQSNNNDQEYTLPATMTNDYPSQQTEQSAKSEQNDNTFPTPLPPYSQYNLPIQKPQQNNPSQPNYPPTNNPAQNFNSQNSQLNKTPQLHLTPQNDIPLQNSQQNKIPQLHLTPQNSQNDIPLQNPHTNNFPMQNTQYDSSPLQKPIYNNPPLLNPPYENEKGQNLQHRNPSQSPLQLNNSQFAKYPSQEMSNLSMENLLTNDSRLENPQFESPQKHDDFPPQNPLPITSQLNPSLPVSPNKNQLGTAHIPLHDNTIPQSNPLNQNSQHDNPPIPNSQYFDQTIKNSQNKNPSVSTPENNNQMIHNIQHNTLLPSSNNANQLAQNFNHENSQSKTSNNAASVGSLSHDNPSGHNPQSDSSTSQQNNPQHENFSLQNPGPLQYLDLTNNSQNSQFEISNDPNKLLSDEISSGPIKVSTQLNQEQSHDSLFPQTPSPLHLAHPKLEQKLPVDPYFIPNKLNKVLPPTRPVGI